MMSKNILLICTLFFLSANASEAINSDELKNINRKGQKDFASSDSNTTDVHRKQNREALWVDEVVLNHILKSQEETKEASGSYVGSSEKLAYNNIAAHMAIEKTGGNIGSAGGQNGASGGSSRETKIDKKPKVVLTGGYCRLLAPLEVNDLAQYGSFSCDLEGSRDKVRLTALIEPEHISKALVGRPLYIKTAKGKRYTIKDGVMMNAKQTSINIASVVNDYALARLIGEGAIDSSRIVSKYARDYLLAKQQSDIEQSVYYGDGNTTVGGLVYGSKPVVTTNRKPPKRRDYVNMAGIELVSKMVDLLGNAFLDKLSYLYKMNADTLYYVDIAVSTDEGMVGVDYTLDNLVAKSPRTIGEIRNNSAVTKSSSFVTTKGIEVKKEQDIDVKKVMQEMRSRDSSKDSSKSDVKKISDKRPKQYNLD
jgi:hypothetical protein